MMNNEMVKDVEMTVEELCEVCDRYLRRGIVEDVLTRDANITGGYELPVEFAARLVTR